MEDGRTLADCNVQQDEECTLHLVTGQLRGGPASKRSQPCSTGTSVVQKNAKQRKLKLGPTKPRTNYFCFVAKCVPPRPGARGAGGVEGLEQLLSSRCAVKRLAAGCSRLALPGSARSSRQRTRSLMFRARLALFFRDFPINNALRERALAVRSARTRPILNLRYSCTARLALLC